MKPSPLAYFNVEVPGREQRKILLRGARFNNCGLVASQAALRQGRGGRGGPRALMMLVAAAGGHLGWLREPRVSRSQRQQADKKNY